MSSRREFILSLSLPFISTPCESSHVPGHWWHAATTVLDLADADGQEMALRELFHRCERVTFVEEGED